MLVVVWHAHTKFKIGSLGAKSFSATFVLQSARQSKHYVSPGANAAVGYGFGATRMESLYEIMDRNLILVLDFW